ncbi:MAG TPA: coniferyl aldehyde dehydrogenase, partial [Desulfosalsimonadaceae bacterium]|nr:coniferyl aldehyde dehydrogenase [Desulfosalsimonadaceae bacterium]
QQEGRNPEETPIEEIHTLFRAQREAFHNAPMPAAKERIDRLKRLKSALLGFQEEFINAVDADFNGRSRDESLMAEVFPSLEGIRYAARRVRRWMRPRRRRMHPMFLPGRARVLYQPLGVTGVIVPWNYPLYLAVSPLTGALAAGNRVMLKMSEYTPRTAAVFRRMIARAFSPGEVAVVTGAADVAAAFAAQPWDHLLFTGSTAVGRHVLRAAAENLTPVTLELGGKSPAVIGPDAVAPDAAARIAFGKSFNAGQTCIAPDYVLCPRGQVEPFVRSFREQVAKMYPRLGDNADYTAIINAAHYERLRELLADAEARGARIEAVNPARESFSSGRKMPLYLLQDVNAAMRVMQEEIFGPVLPIVACDSLDEAVRFVNARPRPLVLYYFGYQRRHADYVINNTHSGGALVNDTLIHVTQDDLPFGGVGASGMGRYHGSEGFATFSNARSVVYKPRFNSMRMIYPPYGRRIHKIIYNMFLR